MNNGTRSSSKGYIGVITPALHRRHNLGSVEIVEDSGREAEAFVLRDVIDHKPPRQSSTLLTDGTGRAPRCVFSARTLSYSFDLPPGNLALFNLAQNLQARVAGKNTQ